MTRLNNMYCISEPLIGTKYSLDVETNDIGVLEYLGKRSGMKGMLFPNNVSFEDESVIPEIKDVIFNDPATIVIWADGSEKTIVKVDERYGDAFDKEKGLAIAICKKAMGNKGNFNEVFKKWIWNNEN